MKIFLLAIRPKTLAASLCPVLMGTAMALKSGAFDALVFLSTLLTALAIQIATNLANDYFDFKKGADTAERTGPLRVMQAGLMSARAMKILLATTLAFSLITGSFLVLKGGLLFFLLLLLALLCAIFYTAGPYSIAYLGLGELFVLIFFGPVAVASVYYLQAHSFSWTVACAGLSCGLLSSAILLVNNIRDAEEDRRAQKKTLVVRLGAPFGRRLFALCMTAPALIPLLFYHGRPFVLLSSLTLLPALFLIKELYKNRIAAHFNILLGKTAKFLIVYTLIFCFGWMS
jgi:1,4-dihydroxy-2-naphthoate octaprenyltransferase